MSFEDELEFVTADKLEEREKEVEASPVEVIDDKEVVEENKEIVPVQMSELDLNNLPDYAILNPDIAMSKKLEVAANVANTLAPLLKSQKLVKKGLNKKEPQKEYVLIEGWTTLGTMLGITPITKVIDVFESAKGRGYGYKAEAILVQNAIFENGEIKYGNILARAEAIDTSNSFRSDEEAIYSMAQTKALGKAYRNALSWIIKMAGFEGTPAEEMMNDGKNK